MADLDFIKSLLIPDVDTKIVFLIIDGVGGLPMEVGGPTELEAARIPNLDALAAEGLCGLHDPVAPGITPGSGPSHLALFGYDPRQRLIRRGVLSAAGIDFPLTKRDLACRGNFCTVDEKGLVVDRRAGRIPSEENEELCELLRREVSLPGVEVFIETVKEYRFVLVLRGDGLAERITDTDPQALGVKPLPARATHPEAERSAELLNEFVAQARLVLADQHPANMVLLRGASKLPDIPKMQEAFGLNPAAIASYPMYRGLAKLVGMETLKAGATVSEEFDTLEQEWDDYDFFYLHVKKTDSYGEDGNFEAKINLIEETDEQVERLMALEPDVVVVTGDHSTPALLRYHSWHPVPVLIWSKHCRTDSAQGFNEGECARGALGRRPATDLMPIALANAMRLAKYGA
ncbi:MAG: 2,3-bisphosphoglycerate-independent phosphoglycerate mutase [Chloroflexota bacterium]|nr:2,3-bisphosphoglycerate-independent phosphoglycerate mutase [Chloroflexota bacterium]